MLPDLNRVIEQVSKEKGIDRQVIVDALKDAMLSAAKRTYGPEKKIEAQWNAEIGEVELFEIRIVVDVVQDAENEVTLEEAKRTIDPDAEVGDELLAKLPSEKFGRIAAQAAKQNIIQRVRDAERDSIFKEFKTRKAELATGTVQRFEKKNIIVNLGRADAILPEKEQIPRERYRQGDRIRAYIVDVELSSRGPQIILSRTHPGLLVELFRQEVPEIYEGIVEVKGAAREPGGRAKFAVTSHDRDVDPVGACVGMRGTRVQAVVQELRNEKIDIVEWTQDQAEYVCRALAPAKVSRIILDEDERAMEVIVPDDQLSLAIGKKGQNVRLASRLTAWKLDVRSESEAEDEARRARASLSAIPGLNDVTAELLYQYGFKSATEVAASDVETLCEIDGIEPERAATILEAAADAVAQEQAAAEAAQAAAEAAQVAAAAAAAEALAEPPPVPPEPVAEEEAAKHIVLDDLDFRLVGVIELERDDKGEVKEQSPQQRYENADGLPLHPYGDGPFCSFSVAKGVRESGVYVVTSDSAVKYVGECENLGERWGSGYGSIQPRNCFVGGQLTNCRINNLILEEVRLGRRMELWFRTLAERERMETETRLIGVLQPPWNIKQRSQEAC